MTELKILEEKENPLFNRKEIKGSIDSEIAPSRAEILEILSKKFNAPAENIKVKKILGKFGSKTFNFGANIYSSEKEKDSIELKKKKEKAPEEKKEAAAEEAPKEQPEAVSEKESEVQQDTELKSQENPEPQGEAKEQ